MKKKLMGTHVLRSSKDKYIIKLNFDVLLMPKLINDSVCRVGNEASMASTGKSAGQVGYGQEKLIRINYPL